MEKETAIEWLFKNLWETPKDKLTWHTILEKAKEMEKQTTPKEEIIICSGELSDDEIIQQVDKVWMYTLNEDFMKGFESGAKWYKKNTK